MGNPDPGRADSGACQAPAGRNRLLHLAVGPRARPSKEARDAGMSKVMSDPRMPQDMGGAPFDGVRMIYGGFTPIVEV